MSKQFEKKLRALYSQRSLKVAYALRRLVGVKSLRSYSSYDEYVDDQIAAVVMRAKKDEQNRSALASSPALKQETKAVEKSSKKPPVAKKMPPPTVIAETSSDNVRVDPLRAFVEARQPDVLLDTVDLWLKSGINVSPTHLVWYVRACVEIGAVHRIEEKLPLLISKVWFSASFRYYYFIALLMIGDFDKARSLALDTVRGGTADKRLLLRIVGESYLLSEPAILRAAAQQLVRFHENELTTSEQIYVYNIVSLQLGDEELLRVVKPGSLAKRNRDAFLFRSNVALRENDLALQLLHFNAALEICNLSTVRAIDPEKPLHVTNIVPADEADRSEGPTVSVLMSTFNSAATVESALRSLREQTHPALEILVVDDCSTDNTLEIVRRCAENDDRIVVHQMAENGGTYRARNFGLSRATGKYFTCHDSDDWAHPTRIQQLVEAIEASADLVAARSQLLRLSRHNGVKPKPAGYMHDDMSSFLFHREAIVKKMGYYCEVTTGADSEFLRRTETVFGEKSVQLIKKPLLIADWSETSLSGSPLTGITEGGTMCIDRAKFRFDFQRAHKRAPNQYYHSTASEQYSDLPRTTVDG